MAKVNFGPIVSEARGKQGNLVFSRNAAGAYTRAYVVPDETETPARRVVWDRFAAACAAWTHALTPSQRDAWAAFASRLSRNPGPINGRPVTGRSIFLHTFTNLDNLGLPTLEDPPTPALLGAISHLSLSVHSLAQEIILDPVEPADAPEQGLIIFATPPLPYPRNSPAGLLKQIAALPPETEYPINLWEQYNAVYAQPAPGDRIIAQATPVAAATGLAGTPLRASALNIVPEDVMLQVTRTLTPQEIKNLRANPIQLVPAPGPGKVLQAPFVQMGFTPGPTAYTYDDAKIGICIGPPDDGMRNLLFSLAGLIDSTTPKTLIASHPDLSIWLMEDSEWLENLPLMLGKWEPGEFADGDGTITLTLQYLIGTCR